MPNPLAKPHRKAALITGAAGGMGQAIARRLGATMDLLLTDVAVEPLRKLAKTLHDEGYCIAAAEAGDLADPKLLSSLMEAASQNDRLGAVVHTAGLSPAKADWQSIVHVNILATQHLLDALEPVLVRGTAAVLIASMAGHIDVGMPDADRLLDGPVDQTVIGALKPMLFAAGKAGEEGERLASQLAYVLTKRAVIRLCEKRAATWGRKGARIVSVSPGLIYTPMGMLEAKSDPGTMAMINAQPVGRWGTSMDIAEAVQFLLGENASFITGCDLRVDGGKTAADTRE